MVALTNTSRLITTSWSGAVVYVTGPVVPPNSWTHVAITYGTTQELRLLRQRKPLQYVVCIFIPSGWIAELSV